MKAFNYLTLAILLFLGATSSLQAQCSATFSYTNTGNNYNFTATTSAGMMNPVYVWTIDDYNNNTTNTVTSVTPTINYNFSGGSPFGYHHACLTVYDSLTNCQTTIYCDSIISNTNPNPCSGFAVTHSHTVSGNTASFTSNVVGGNPMYSYAWNFHGLGSSSVANPSFTYPGPGWYAADVTVYDTLGCQATYHDSVYISGNTNPCNTSVWFVDSLAMGNSVTFHSYASGFGAGAYYSWDFGNGVYASGQYPTVTLSNGWHYVCLTVDDSICVETYCDSIYVNGGNPNPCNTFVSFSSSVTTGNHVTLQASTSGFGAGTSYTWNIGGSSIIVGGPTVTFPASNGWYSVCLTVDDSLCTETYCDSIYVNGGNTNPCSGTISFTDSLSSGNNVTFNSSVSGFGAGAFYAWTFGTNFQAYGPNPTVQLSNGWYQVCLTVSDSSCTETYCDSIYVNGSNPNPCNTSVWFFDSLSTGNNITFHSSAYGFGAGAYYSWDFGNGVYASGQYPTVNLSNGWHYVCLTVDDSLCTETYCDSIYVNGGNPNPCNTSVWFIDSLAMGNSVTFHSSASGFGIGTYYSWDFGNGVYASGQYPTVNLSNGWHLVCLTVSDSLCTETYCDSIYVNGGNPNPCAQNAVTLNLLFDNYATETSWTVTDANGVVVANGGNYSSAMNGQNLPINLCLPTGCYNFNIYDSYGDGICCLYGQGSYTLVDDSTGMTLVSGGSFTYSETTNFCVGGASNSCGNFGNGSFTYSVGANGVVTFTPVLTSNQYPLNFTWDFGNGNTSNSSNPTFTFTNGYHLVCLTADSANCTFTYCDSIMVTTNNGNPTGPCANLTTDLHITQSINDPFLLWMQPVVNGAASNAGFTFVWDFGDGTGAMSGAPLHTYNSFGSYVVCLMALDTVNGCVSTFCDTITVDSVGNFSRNFTKPGFTVNMLPPVINYYTAVEEVEEGATTINLFPNPANSVVHLAISTEEAIDGTISILDLTGKVAYMNNLNVGAGQEQVSLPIEQLPAGVYVVRITSETTQQTMKFVKE
ncbi:PKD domain-containing protein [Aureispira sp. CCB-QB1]|uniref:PKD domain-containing protein n=1 Tax=Aureispira sp. CCB-QB1 TaxID=1313421 RepID=UPI000695FFF1|nr:PKD domain-containing protein [Aureispira sp. CCB-QB1]